MCMWYVLFRDKKIAYVLILGYSFTLRHKCKSIGIIVILSNLIGILIKITFDAISSIKYVYIT